VIEKREKWRRKQQRDVHQIYVVLLFLVKISRRYEITSRYSYRLDWNNNNKMYYRERGHAVA
jgi:hypothetical protein